MEHTHEVQIYYEDTDLSGLVYHANYLRYCERAREHLIGPAELVRLWEEEGIGFVVYKCELTFREGARLADVLQIRTSVENASGFRLVFQQNVWRGDKLIVEGAVHLVCVNRENQLIRLPKSVTDGVAAFAAQQAPAQ